MHQGESRFEVENAGRIEGHEFPQAVAGHQVGAAALLAQAIHQQALDHEQGRLGVAGVVEVRGLGDGIEPFAGADRQQVAAQQLGGEGKTLAGVRQIEHGRCHAEFL